MGRALKIKKTNIGAGTTVTGSNPVVTTYNQNVLVDQGYPNFGSLTDPYYGSADVLSANDFLGVVGGSPATSTATTSFPVIAAVVNVALADGTNTTYGAGRIIRQKGAHKFLVAYIASATSDGSFIVGQAYQIASYGTTTDWSAAGAGTQSAQGDVFTATSVGGSGNGTAYPVGQCVLANTDQPDPGYMSIAFSVADSTAVYASYITNKWVRDWTGMTYDSYSPANVGTNVTSGELFYPVNFFSDEGTMTWSGAEVIGGAQAQNGSIQLAQVAKATS